MQLTDKQARKLVNDHGSPLYIYSEALIKAKVKELKQLKLPYGLTIRYALKANHHKRVVNLLTEEGLHFDASSSYEAQELLDLGVKGHLISLSSQQPSHNLQDLLKAGVLFVATSLHQLELFANCPAGAKNVGLRINPAIGSGYNNRLTTGGLASSFGLWHDYLPQALALAKRHGISIDRLHIHVGTGADPAIWGRAIDLALAMVDNLPDVTSLDMGGGYKIAYSDGDVETDLTKVAAVFAEKLTRYAKKTGRKLKLEIEPGRWLVVRSGCLLTEIVDIVDTGNDGFTFLRTNTGMNDFIRPMMYGAQHRMAVLNTSKGKASYVVVGHNCETGDILTPAPKDPESIMPRELNKASIGDLMVIYDMGAYCASMSAKGYNSFPQAPEIFI